VAGWLRELEIAAQEAPTLGLAFTVNEDEIFLILSGEPVEHSVTWMYRGRLGEDGVAEMTLFPENESMPKSSPHLRINESSCLNNR
jgi:hypothetical protein